MRRKSVDSYPTVIPPKVSPLTCRRATQLCRPRRRLSDTRRLSLTVENHGLRESHSIIAACHPGSQSRQQMLPVVNGDGEKADLAGGTNDGVGRQEI